MRKNRFYKMRPGMFPGCAIRWKRPLYSYPIITDMLSLQSAFYGPRVGQNQLKMVGSSQLQTTGERL